LLEERGKGAIRGEAFSECIRKYRVQYIEVRKNKD